MIERICTHKFILFQIAKDAKECVQECVSEFISFITSEYPFHKVNEGGNCFIGMKNRNNKLCVSTICSIKNRV